MALASTLESSVLPLIEIRAEYVQQLTLALDSIPGSKHLILDTLMSSVLTNLFDTGTSLLHDHGVLALSELSSSTPHQIDDVTTIVYLVRPTIACTKMVVSGIQNHPTPKEVDWYIIFLPAANAFVEEVLHLAGVREMITLLELPLGFIPIDTDLLTLNAPEVLRDCYISGNNTSLKHVAQSLFHLEKHCGEIAEVHFKGAMAKRVWLLLMELKTSSCPSTRKASSSGLIDHLILLDRKVDMASALMTALTYEGLLDECFTIENGFISVPNTLLESEDVQSGNTSKEDEVEEYTTVALNSNDDLYRIVREMHIGALGTFLHRKTETIRKEYTAFRETSHEASVAQVHAFVTKLPELKRKLHTLTQHIHIAEHVDAITKSASFRTLWETERGIIEGYRMLDNINTMIDKHDDFLKVLRLLCLESFVSGGFQPFEMDNLRVHLVQTYGYEVILTLEHLETVGFLKAESKKHAAFENVRQDFNLVVPSVNVTKPNDSAYVTSGVAPLSVRLVEKIIINGDWTSVSKTLHGLPGPTASISHKNTTKTKGKKTILVCMIGGATYLELTALRELTNRIKEVDIVLSTTAMMNGNTLMKTVLSNAVTRYSKTEKE